MPKTMSTLSITRSIAQPRPAVWQALADFGGVHRFHPLVERSPLHEGTPPQGVGAERTCHFYDGNQVQERVVEAQTDRALEIEMFAGSMPIRDARIRFELSATAGNTTEIRTTMRYVPKLGLLGRLMDTLMIRRKLSGTLDLLFDALDEHLRTGEPIGRGFVPSRAA